MAKNKNKFLPHYYNILNKIDTAYYLICKNFEVDFNKNMKTDELWKIHDSISIEFKQQLQKVEDSPIKLDYYEKVYKNKSKSNDNQSNFNSFLNLKIELANRILNECEFCENSCKINRYKGEVGFCGMDPTSYISSAFLHLGEEPPLVPSGTIFFSGCTFDCVFCQNWDISTIGKSKYKKREKIDFSKLEFVRNVLKGQEIGPKQLAELSLRLSKNGAKNINYVGGDPTPNIHTILESLKYLDVNIPQLWNSNFYNSIKALKLLNEIIDIWLPDFKYGNNDCAKTYSGIKNYYDVITRNFKFIYNNSIVPNNENEKNYQRSIIIRHLVMPGHYECCTKPILEWISKEIPNVLVNIMAQYHPDHLVNNSTYSEINRRVSYEEMAKAFTLAEGLGINYQLVS